MNQRWSWRFDTAIYGASLGCFVSSILDGDMTYAQTALIMFILVIFVVLATWRMKVLAKSDW